MSNFSKRIAREGVIAGLYVALSFISLPISSGPIQFRISEGLTLLPLFLPEAIPALFVGCFVSNVVAGCIVPDIILGSVITLVSATLTYFIGRLFSKTWLKVLVGGVFPVILNAFFLPLIWYYFTGLTETYMLSVLYIFSSQTLTVYVIGTPMCLTPKKCNLY